MSDSENQDFPGVYTSNGATLTYTQPPESLGAISSMPYTARIPSSSNCVTFQSNDLFASLPLNQPRQWDEIENTAQSLANDLRVRDGMLHRLASPP